jgi:hypothetical protein
MSRPAPGYANCSELNPPRLRRKRVPKPGRVGLPGRPFGGPGALTLGSAHDYPQHGHRRHRRRRCHRRHRPARLTPHTRRSRKESSGGSLDSREAQRAAPDGFRNAASSAAREGRVVTPDRSGGQADCSVALERARAARGRLDAVEVGAGRTAPVAPLELPQRRADPGLRPYRWRSPRWRPHNTGADGKAAEPASVPRLVADLAGAWGCEPEEARARIWRNMADLFAQRA